MKELSFTAFSVHFLQLAPQPQDDPLLQPGNVALGDAQPKIYYDTGENNLSTFAAYKAGLTEDTTPAQRSMTMWTP